MNGAIRVEQVRVIDELNNKLGIMPTGDAIAIARERNLDLVEVSPTGEPPVCRIMDFGKWLYEQKRKVRLQQKKQHTTVSKEIRLRPEIDLHDLNIKINKSKELIEKGHRVQFTMLFRGREMMHIDQGYTVMNQIVETLAELAKVDRQPKMAGRRMIMVVLPK